MERIKTIERAAKAAGRRLSGIPTPGRDAASLFADGCDPVLANFDLIMLRDAARAGVRKLRTAASR